MDIAAILKSLQDSGLASRIRESLLWFPLLESTHVIGLALVFGTIAIIDLRLLGLASAARSFKRLYSDTLKWTIAGFVIAAITGSLMFITNATTYYHNFYFRAKMLLLVVAGINVLVFEMTLGRQVKSWGDSPAPPRAGRAAGALSLVLWISIIFMGRLIGFTTSRTAVAPPAPAGVDFDDFLKK